MATGMVLVIVMRNIDLSVGSVEGLVGMIMGFAQVHFLIRTVGLGLGNPWIWVIALAIGLAIGLHDRRAARLHHRLPRCAVLHRHAWRPADMARGRWWVTSGADHRAARRDLPADGRRPARVDRREMELDRRRRRLRRRCAGAAQRQTPAAALQIPAASGLGRGISSASSHASIILGAVWIANAYPWPAGIVKKYAEASGIPVPDGGLFIAHGIAIPVLMAIAVGVVMTFITRRTRFGRYVFAIGGNPEAANLAGINTRWVTMQSVHDHGPAGRNQRGDSSARLNSSTNALGTLDELLVIAAAVIGGTSLAGGSGTVLGAMLGALLMQSLQSGMVLLGVDSPMQSIVVGAVLVIAVWLDTVYRKRV